MFAPIMGMRVEMAREIASAFAGGMAMGAECGAVTGARMIIGIKYGKTRDRDVRAEEKTFAKLAEFMAEFQSRHDHILCSPPQETDMSTSEGINDAKRRGHFTHRCPRFVAFSVEILESLLE